MNLYSTNNQKIRVPLNEAVLKGLPDDNGLYMPVEIPQLPTSFFQRITQLTIADIAFETTKCLLNGAIPDNDLKEIIDQAINFPAPLVPLGTNQYVLELFHGPSLAFKDFGARFMAGLMSYFNQGQDDDLVVLVATSGDTGGAVASGFFNKPGVKVVILYPKNRVSRLQEYQLTTWGGNIIAVEINGSFDDCQSLVKRAFLDKGLSSKLRLTSANSINISRLIPQMYYYFEAYKQLLMLGEKQVPVFVVPSGNFGNLTAGLIAKRMGLPVESFIAAINSNTTFVEYLKTGKYDPKKSVETLSNAMDVGNPSNFDRILDLYKGDNDGSTWNNVNNVIKSVSISDDETISQIIRTSQKNDYSLDPHTAVGLVAANKIIDSNVPVVVLGTAHPIKFLNKTKDYYSKDLDVPPIVRGLFTKNPMKRRLRGSEFDKFKFWLIGCLS